MSRLARPDRLHVRAAAPASSAAPAVAGLTAADIERIARAVRGPEAALALAPGTPARSRLDAQRRAAGFH